MKKKVLVLAFVILSLALASCKVGKIDGLVDSVDSGYSQPTETTNTTPKIEKEAPEVSQDEVENQIDKVNVTVPTFVVENVTVSKSDTRIPVRIFVKKNPGIASIALTLSYDRKILQLVDFEVNPQIGGQYMEYNPAVKIPKVVWLKWDGNVEGDWEFATLFFKAADGASSCKTTVSVSYNENDVYNFKEENVKFDVIAGSVMVK